MTFSIPEILYLKPIEIDLSKRSEPGWTWPFKTMDIGDCYSVPDPSEHANATCSYQYVAKKLDRKFKRKTLGRNLWIWRIK